MWKKISLSIMNCDPSVADLVCRNLLRRGRCFIYLFTSLPTSIRFFIYVGVIFACYAIGQINNLFQFYVLTTVSSRTPGRTSWPYFHLNHVLFRLSAFMHLAFSAFFLLPSMLSFSSPWCSFMKSHQ